MGERSLSFPKVPFLLLQASILQQGKQRLSEAVKSSGKWLRRLAPGLDDWRGQGPGGHALFPPQTPGSSQEPCSDRVTLPHMHPGHALVRPGPGLPPRLCAQPSLAQTLLLHSLTMCRAQIRDSLLSEIFPGAWRPSSSP